MSLQGVPSKDVPTVRLRENRPWNSQSMPQNHTNLAQNQRKITSLITQKSDWGCLAPSHLDRHTEISQDRVKHRTGV